MIRVIGPRSELNSDDGGTIFVNGTAVNSTGGTENEDAEDTGAARSMSSPSFLLNILVIAIFIRSLWAHMRR